MTRCNSTAPAESHWGHRSGKRDGFAWDTKAADCTTATLREYLSRQFQMEGIRSM
jgi:hypothetical protein